MRCNAVDYSQQCSRKSDDYFWYHDGTGAYDHVFGVCHEHSQTIYSKLLETEMQNKRLIETISKKIQYLNSENKKQVSIENHIRSREARILSEKRSRIYEHLNNIRNRTCRLCNFPLDKPPPKRQNGNSYSHADLHSETGKRREVILFHTECGLIWLDAKFNTKLRKVSDGQEVLLNFVN